jgi:predicted secreted protein
MGWTSLIAIYALFWVLSAFMVMPFGMRTHDEAGIAKIPGQAESAPANFRPLRIIKRTSLLALVLCGLYYANFVNGWVTPKDINFFGEPPNFDGTTSK